MNSFPNILLQRAITNQVLYTEKSSINTLFRTLEFLRITYNQGVKGSMYEPLVFIRGSSWSKPNQEILELLSKNKLFQSHAEWIYKNIILRLTTDYMQSTDVKIRVALCMLTNVNMSKDLYIYVCNCIIDNIEELSKALLDEELPF